MSISETIFMRNYLAKEEKMIGEEISRKMIFFHTSNRGAGDFINLALLDKAVSLFASEVAIDQAQNIIRDLVMNPSHHSIVVVNEEGKISGAATYHAYLAQSFAEVIFFAVIPDLRRAGFGTRMMNYLKKIIRDNHQSIHMIFCLKPELDSVKFLMYQGFSKVITQNKARMEGCMDNCPHASRGNKMMGFCINPTLPYTNIPYMVRMQLQVVEHHSKLLEMQYIFQENPTVHPTGDSIIPDMNSFPWLNDVKTAASIHEIWTRSTLEVHLDDFEQIMSNVVQELMNQPHGWPFMLQVNPEVMPDFYETADRPINLTEVSERVQQGEYHMNLYQFVQDLRRMFRNWRIFRNGTTLYLTLANKLEFCFFRELCLEIRKGASIRMCVDDSDDEMHNNNSVEDPEDDNDNQGEEGDGEVFPKEDDDEEDKD